MRLLIHIYLIHQLLFGLSNPALGNQFGELDREDSNSDSVIVEGNGSSGYPGMISYLIPISYDVVMECS